MTYPPAQYHILNGDALKERFPTKLQGEILVIRECLVDGDVEGPTLEGLLSTRARFMERAYHTSRTDYHALAAAELRKIAAIAAPAEVCLWFEDDLFCQVNFWFALWLLPPSLRGHCWLVRPEGPLQYGFGGPSTAELYQAYEKRTLISAEAHRSLASLWPSFQARDLPTMRSLANEQSASFPFLSAAIEAYAQSIPAGDWPGRPKKTLKELISELNTREFGPVFQAFCKREAIYGFGDLQVKRLFDELLSEMD